MSCITSFYPKLFCSPSLTIPSSEMPFFTGLFCRLYFSYFHHNFLPFFPNTWILRFLLFFVYGLNMLIFLFLLLLQTIILVLFLFIFRLYSSLIIYPSFLAYYIIIFLYLASQRQHPRSGSGQTFFLKIKFRFRCL